MPIENTRNKESLQHLNYETIMMKHEYLRGWKQFKAGSASVLPYFIKYVKQDKDHVEGQLHALLALSSCKMDMQELREEIV